MHSLSPNAALLLIDLQKAVDDPSWGVRNNPDAEARVGRLLACWRAAGRPIIHVRHVSREPGSTYRPGQPGVEFKPEAAPRAGEDVVTKHRPGAFAGTDLESMLHRRGITEVVIAGVITNNSVEATARAAGDLGFRTVVVADATFTFGRRDYDGRIRTAEEVHAMSLGNLEGEYAEIAPTADVLTAAGAAPVA
jgi:nicotinamidase-related amidase